MKPIDEAKSFRVYDRLEYIASGKDRFLGERGYRLNYYAITALLARVYLYAGNLDMAYDEAIKIINIQKTKRFLISQMNIILQTKVISNFMMISFSRCIRQR